LVFNSTKMNFVSVASKTQRK